MTYGVYTRDLKSSYIEGVELGVAMRCCSNGDRVVCSERNRRSSFAVYLLFHAWRGIRVKPQYGEMDLGLISVRWNWNYRVAPVKVVYDPASERSQEGCRM